MIESLGAQVRVATGGISGVALLGHGELRTRTRNEGALVIEVPDTEPCAYAYDFEIQVAGNLL